MSEPPPARSYGCPECGEDFDTEAGLDRHRRIRHGHPKPREGLSMTVAILLVILAIVIIVFVIGLAALSGY